MRLFIRVIENIFQFAFFPWLPFMDIDIYKQSLQQALFIEGEVKSAINLPSSTMPEFLQFSGKQLM